MQVKGKIRVKIKDQGRRFWKRNNLFKEQKKWVTKHIREAQTKLVGVVDTAPPPDFLYPHTSRDLFD